MPGIELASLTSEEVGKLQKQTDTLCVGIGSFETHGPHLPMASDVYAGEAILGLARERMQRTALFLPTLDYGITYHCGHSFPGTISLSDNTLIGFCRDVAKYAAWQGFRKLVFINFHGGNPQTLNVATGQIREDFGILPFVVCVLSGTSFEKYFPNQPLGHGCAAETSLMLAVRPDLVRDYRHAPRVEPREFPGRLKPVFWPDWWWHTRGQGHIGFPENANVEAGKKMIEESACGVAELIDAIVAFDPGEFTGHEPPHAPLEANS